MTIIHKGDPTALNHSKAAATTESPSREVFGSGPQAARGCGVL